MTALPLARQLLRARDLADQSGDRRTLSEALRHLGIAEHRAGRYPLWMANADPGAYERLARAAGLRPPACRQPSGVRCHPRVNARPGPAGPGE